MEYKGQKESMTSEELSRLFSHIGGRIMLWCFPVFVYGVVRLFRIGFFEWQGLIMIIGSLLAYSGTVCYIVCVEAARNERSWRAMFLGVAGFLPYLFGCFLVFYKGFWSFKYLFNSFSMWGLVEPIIWIVVGYQVVLQTYNMSEIGTAIDEGKIKIEDTPK